MEKSYIICLSPANLQQYASFGSPLLPTSLLTCFATKWKKGSLSVGKGEAEFCESADANENKNATNKVPGSADG